MTGALHNERSSLDDVRGALRYLNAQGTTYAELATEIGIKPNVLKQFVHRRSTTARHNETYQKIIGYLSSERVAVYLSAKDRRASQIDNLRRKSLAAIGEHRKNTGPLYERAKRIFRIPTEEVKLVAQKIRGKYFCYRHSIIPNRIVKTALTFYRIRDQIHFTHYYVDRYFHGQFGEDRRSMGLVLPMRDNLYLMGAIEGGAGFEMMMLLQPISARFTGMDGFIVSMSADRRPLLSRFICERASGDEFIGGFARDDLEFRDVVARISDKLDNLGQQPVALTLLPR